MKKAYVKPVMESEAFVANEYVAACWTMTCTNSTKSCGDYEYKGDTSVLGGLSLQGGSTTTGSGTYTGTIDGKSGCRDKYNPKDYNWTGTWWDIAVAIEWIIDYFTGNQGTTTWSHPVEVTKGHYDDNNKFHPYASV